MYMNYKPNPIDTSDVILDNDLLELTEMLAANTHSIWAKNRIEQGWKYGRERDDAKKQTPCLIPYNELSEEEKNYDRNTALETLKVIQKLGYKIEKTCK